MTYKKPQQPPFTPPQALPRASPSASANGASSDGPEADMAKVLESRQAMVDFVEGVLAQVKAGGVHGVGIALVTEKGLGAGFSLMTDGFLLSGAIERLRVQLEESVLHPNLKVEREQRTRIIAGQMSEESLMMVLANLDAKVARGELSPDAANTLREQLGAAFDSPSPDIAKTN